MLRWSAFVYMFRDNDARHWQRAMRGLFFFFFAERHPAEMNDMQRVSFCVAFSDFARTSHTFSNCHCGLNRQRYDLIFNLCIWAWCVSNEKYFFFFGMYFNIISTYIRAYKLYMNIYYIFHDVLISNCCAYSLLNEVM